VFDVAVAKLITLMTVGTVEWKVRYILVQSLVRCPMAKLALEILKTMCLTL
jgi:hypothetical protein